MSTHANSSNDTITTRSWSAGHPYIPNSAPAVKARMLAEIGIADLEEVFAEIPTQLRLDRLPTLPPALVSEWELSRHFGDLLGRNRSTSQALSFLGAGCYDHHVPAVCSEINSRAEFLTAYAGEPYEDHGKWQALFEYTSLMAELLELDVVNVPTYDGFQASATSLRMAGRVTGRSTVLVSEATSAEKLARITDYLDGALQIRSLPYGPDGRVDPQTVIELLDADVAAVYLESPNVFGVLESGGPQIATAAHAAGAMVVVSTDPVCLGFVQTPAAWGADLVCGDIQSLGLGMHFGGANGGFIGGRDTERVVMEYPSRIFGLAPTAAAGELGFCDIAYERTSLANRELGNEWVGTAAALWGITAGVYLSLMGPSGMRDLGTAVAARTRYAIDQIAQLPGISVPFAAAPHWREFLVAVDPDGPSIAELNERLLAEGIYGLVDLGDRVDLWPNSGLVAVTEKHSRQDIDRLVAGLRKVMM